MSKISQDIILNATIDKKTIAMNAAVDKSLGIYHDETIDGKGTKNNPLRVNTKIIATKKDLESKQDKLTAGANIRIEDNVISSTAQESFFRGRYKNWDNVPTDSSLYQANYRGETTPSYNDYIVVENASLYVPGDFGKDPRNVTIVRAGGPYDINVIIDGVTTYYYTQITGWTALTDWLSIIYIAGAPGIWRLKSTKEFYLNNELKAANTTIDVMNTNQPEGTTVYASENPGVAPIALSGSWRFLYNGVWATDGIEGWKPEYQIEKTLPMATETQAGIAKLYKTSGSNSDGAMTQRAVGAAISAYSYSKTEIDNMIGDIATALDTINGEVI